MLAENKRLLGQRQRTIIHSISSSQSIVFASVPFAPVPTGNTTKGRWCLYLEKVVTAGYPELREPKSFITGSEPAWMLPCRDTTFILLNDKQTWLVFFEGKHSFKAFYYANLENVVWKKAVCGSLPKMCWNRGEPRIAVSQWMQCTQM